MTKLSKVGLSPFSNDEYTRTTFMPPIDSHLKPHLDQIRKELHVVEMARTEALANRPSKDDFDLDETQLKIIARVEEGANFVCQFGASQMNRALAEVRTRMPRAMDATVALASVDGDIAQVKAGFRPLLVKAFKANRLATRRLNKFIRDNAQALGDRVARYADNPWWPAAVLLALWTLETGINAFLFQKASSLGYTGGFVQAGLFGLVNVALGFFFGFLGLRLVVHVKPLLQILGAVFGVGFLSLGVAWSLIVAAYRQLLQTNPDASSLDAAQFSIPSNWFHITTAESWALLLLGIIIFALAALKGRGGAGGFWDSYLGYKPADLEHRESEAVYEEGQNELRDGIHEAILTCRDKLRADFNADEEPVRKIADIAMQAEERAGEITDFVSEWARMGIALIAEYRTENIAIRTDEPPAYFNVPPKMPVLARNLPSAAAVSVLAERAKQITAANAAVLVEAEKKFADLLAREEELFLAEIEQIEKRAATEIDLEQQPQAV